MQPGEALHQENERLRRENSRFAGWLSLLTHDLRNTFTTLQMLIYAHREGTIDDKQFFQLLVRLEADAATNLKMLEDSNDYIRTQLEDFEPQNEELDLQALVKELSERLHARLDAKQLTLQIDVPHDAVLVTDRVLLRYILLALLENAVKFSHPGQNIDLKLQFREEQVVISVSDTGTGMTEEQLGQLFVLGSARYNGTAGETGAGLGLKIADTFARQLGGRLTVSSQPGKGTAVAVWLPQNER